MADDLAARVPRASPGEPPGRADRMAPGHGCWTPSRRTPDDPNLGFRGEVYCLGLAGCSDGKPRKALTSPLPLSGLPVLPLCGTRPPASACAPWPATTTRSTAWRSARTGGCSPPPAGTVRRGCGTDLERKRSQGSQLLRADAPALRSGSIRYHRSGNGRGYRRSGRMRYAIEDFLADLTRRGKSANTIRAYL